MKLIFLGTSGAIPTPERNLPSAALRMDNGKLIILDAGEDVQRAFIRANLRFNIETFLLISHMHGDHVIGIPGLLATFHLRNRTEPLTVIGPPNIATYILFQLKLIGLGSIEYPFKIIEIIPEITSANHNGELSPKTHRYKKVTYSFPNGISQQGEKTESHAENSIIYDDKGFKIGVFPVRHSVLTFGYRIEESKRPGKFNPERALELGVPRGHLWKKMQMGQAVKLKDGRIVDPLNEGIIGKMRPGRVIVYTGDTTYFPELPEYCKNADILICESTYGEEHRDLAIEKQHMTAKMAARVASEAKVSRLYLTHFSNRYKDERLLEMEAREIFRESYAAHDLMEVEIPLKE